MNARILLTAILTYSVMVFLVFVMVSSMYSPDTFDMRFFFK